ncbi:V-type ATPase subunit [Candidatus Bathyarchaeota archaeon]|nr:V-type ATPase subunit [Candidatus Bathyarchaeota archaeon]
MRRPGNYEYVNALVRAHVGRLLRESDYKAVLGCSKPSEIRQVLSSSSYSHHLSSTVADSFAAIEEAISSSASEAAARVIAASPEPAKPILNEYKLCLESRSLVNALRLQLSPEDAYAHAGVVPLGAIPSEYYRAKLAASADEYSVHGLGRAVAESLQAARLHRSTVPLLRIILHLCERFLDAKPEGSQEEKASLKRLVTCNIDGANIEAILASTSQGVCRDSVRNFLSRRGSLPVESLPAALDLQDTKQLLIHLRRSRYGPCLEMRPGEVIDHLLVRLPYAIMMQESQYALAGYPFKASVVAAGITLKLLEARNLRLATAGASGLIEKASALRLMVAP